MRFIQMPNQTKISSIEFDYLSQLIQKTIDKRGTQYPNPAVGAMIIKGRKIISEGYHIFHGDRHAEAQALIKAGRNAKGATLIITLEPCIHKGKTPPCSKAIIDAQISRVIWAINDPNPLMCGKAADHLKSHGIDVIPHCMPDDGLRCLPEFHMFHTAKRPFIYVKAAMSLDGMIAPNSDGLNYISSNESLTLVQKLRTYVQAICVGANTINTDQPRLTIRLDRSFDFQPMVVILDPKNNVDHTWILDTLKSGRKVCVFRSKPIEIEHDHLYVNTILNKDKGENWRQIFSFLYDMNIHSVLVEGGSGVFQSILSEGYFDELWITKVPKVFGSSGVPFIDQEQNLNLDVDLISVNSYGSDVVIKYRNRHAFLL